MARRRIFRDYRPGKNKGKFASEETYNRSQAQGVDCHIHGEYIETPDEDTITNVDQLFDLWDKYGDEPDLEEYEFHGTGDTGKRK